MKKIFYLIILFLWGCTAKEITTLTEANSEQNFLTSTGSEIIISLTGNATTGYAWNFSSDSPSAYQILQDEYQPDEHPQGMVGVGGHHIFHIKTLQKGTFTISARYYRPWEEFDPQKDKQLSFPIEVE